MNKQQKKTEANNSSLYSRRNFLRTGGIAVAGTGLILTACSDSNDPLSVNPGDGGDDEIFDLGGGDVGVLNYAYALEQLEAAFYQMVLDGSYWAGAEQNEKDILEDLRNHEVIHRELFKTALNSVVDPAQVLPELEFDFSSVDFNNRMSVLTTARILEDTGVSAYNGGGAAIQNPDYLVLAGKIVSVEARHASAIRSLLNPMSKDFAGDDIVDDNGLDPAQLPSVILQAVAETGFITTEFTANELP